MANDTGQSGRNREGRGRKVYLIVISVLAAALTVPLAYLVIVNALINTPFFKARVSAPGSVWIEYGSAWTWVPGRVRVRGIRIHARDSNVEWQLTVDDARFSLAFTHVLSRRFEASDVHGIGVTFRLRTRRPKLELSVDDARRLPPIAGFADLPLKEENEPPPPPSDNEYELWTAELKGVVAEDVREVWVETFRLVPNGATATGGFYLRPLRLARIGPARLDVPSGTVFRGSDVVLNPIRASLEVTTAAYDPREVSGSNILKTVTAKGEVSGDLPSLALLNGIVRTGPFFGQGGGHLDVSADVREGVLTPGSRAHLRAQGAELTTPGTDTSTGGLDVFAAVEQEGGKRDLHLRALGTHIVLTSGVARDANIHVASVKLDAQTDSTDLTEAVPTRVVADVEGVSVPNLRALQPLLGQSDVRLLRGSLTGSLSARIAPTERVASLSSNTQIRDAAASLSGSTITASASVDLRARGTFPFDGRLDLSGSSLTVTGGSIEHENKKSDPFSGKVSARRVILSTRPSVKAQGDIHASLSNGALAWLLETPLRDLPGWLVNAILSGDVEADARASIQKGGFDLDPFSARGKNLRADGTYHKRGGGEEGNVVVRSGPFSAEIQLHDGATSVKLGAFLPALKLP